MSDFTLYDRLIDEIPADVLVKDVRTSKSFSIVFTEQSCGIGVCYDVQNVLPLFSKDWRGQPLKDLAQCVKSWNLVEASMGAAAINAYYNSVEMANKNNIKLGATNYSEDRMSDPFIAYQRQIQNKNVAVIGHFPYLETLFEPYCDLKIIDNTETNGDYPLASAEYILPESDFVFISCGMLTLKLLPRFLELSKNAFTILVGPATPMAPLLFDYGVDDLSGFIFKDMDMAERIISGGMFASFYQAGNKVHMTRDKGIFTV